MLVALSDFKVWIGFDPADTTSDTRLTASLLAAEAAVKTHCERDFEYQQYQETLGPFDVPKDVFQLDNYPVVSMLSLLVGGETWVQDTNYYLNARSGIVHAIDGFMSAGTTVGTQYVAGYTVSTVPADLCAGIKEQASWIFSRGGSSWLKSERLGDRQYTAIDLGSQSVGLIPTAAQYVQNYRRLLFSLD